MFGRYRRKLYGLEGTNSQTDDLYVFRVMLHKRQNGTGLIVGPVPLNDLLT